MTARETALQILMIFEREKSRLDALFESQLKTTGLSSRERKFVSNLVSGVVRYRLLLDWKAATLFKGNYKTVLDKFKLILALALYELDYLEFIPPRATLYEYVEIAKKRLPAVQVSTVNGILRTYLRTGKTLRPEKKFKYPETRLSVQYSYPEWLIKRWLGRWDESFVEALCRAMNQRPVFDLRLNKRKIDGRNFEEKLVQTKIAYTVSPYLPEVYRITDIQKIQNEGFLANGYCSVQDESGMMAVRLLETDKVSPNESVLDLCSAPGSKYTALLEKNINLHLTALELRYERLLKVRGNCRRLGLPDRALLVGDAGCPPFANGTFTKILVDAPCSGLGTIQKHPDIKWRRSLEEILAFQRLQVRMLLEADRLLKPGGTLVYCTCTIDTSENEEVVKLFLAGAGERYRLVPPTAMLSAFQSDGQFLRTFPHLHGMEGSFAARFEKNKSV